MDKRHGNPGRRPAKDRPAEEPLAAPGPTVSWRLPIALGVGLLAAVLIVHWPVLSARALCFDDNQYLTHNILVQNPSAANAWRFLREVTNPSTVGGYYQPLTMISLMVDHAAGGRPDYLRPFHRTALALHAANTLLVFLFLLLLFRDSRSARAGAGHVWAAAGLALIFGLHPMTVEPLAWLGERKTLLATLFVLLGLVMYVRYARGGRRSWLVGCTAAYVLALMSKPTSTPFPVLLLLLDYWPLRRLSLRAVLEKVPFFVIGLASAIITIISQAQTAIITPGQRGLGSILLILCHNAVFYLWKILWPVHLSSYYPPPEPLGLAHPAVLAGVVGTMVLLAALLVASKWTRAALTGWLFFFLAILPTMGVIGFTIVVASDKYAYLPAVGLLLPLAYLWGKSWGRSRATRWCIAGGVLVIAAGEALATRGQVQHWRDTETLYQYMLRLQPAAWRLRDNLSIELLDRGRLDEAARHARDAVRLNPKHTEGYVNLGNALFKLGDLDEALRQYRQALAIEPRDAAAHYDIGNVLQAQGKTDEAIQSWNEALRIRSEYPDVHINLGAALLEKGDLTSSLQHCQAAASMQPNNAQAHNNLGMTLYAMGKKAEAVAEWGMSLKLDPTSADTCNSLGGAMLEAGRVQEAIRYYRQALRLQPNHALARQNLANALGQGGAPASAGRGAGGNLSTQSAPAER